MNTSSDDGRDDHEHHRRQTVDHPTQFEDKGSAADQPDPPDLELDFLGHPLGDVEHEQRHGVDPVDRHRADGEFGALILQLLAEEDDEQKRDERKDEQDPGERDEGVAHELARRRD